MADTPDIPMITRLHVKNYKGLANIDVRFGSLNVLVGANGSGKSSLVDVLRFIRDALTRTLDSAILDRHGMSAIRTWSAKGQAFDLSIAIEITGRGWIGRYEFVLGSETRGDYRIKYERIQCSITRETTLPQTISRDVAILIKEGEIVEGPQELRDIFNQSITRDDSTLKLSMIHFIHPIVTNLYSFLTKMGFYTIYPDALREPQKPSNAHPLEEQGRNLASVLRDIKSSKHEALQHITEALAQVVIGVREYSVTQVGGYLVTRLHHDVHDPASDRNGPAFELAQESDGTLRMLGILAALYQSPARPVITIEEPELAIHPGALGVLCDVINEASLRSQIMLTTHNPDLLDRLPDAHFLVVERKDGISTIGPLSDGQQQAIAKKLFSPGELMRVQGLEMAEQE